MNTIGLVASLSEFDRQNLIDVVIAIVRNDGRSVGKLMMERSKLGMVACKNPDGFCDELEQIISEVHKVGLALGRVSIGSLLQKLLIACYIHNVKLESKFVSVILAMGVLEGLGRRLDPDIDILQLATFYVLRNTASKSFLN